MNTLAEVPVEDLRSRMETVLRSLQKIFTEVGPKLKEMGNLNEESRLIYKELHRRGLIKVEDRKDAQQQA